MMCPPLVVKGKKHAVEAGVRCKKRMQTEFRTSGSLSALPTINSKTWATPPPKSGGCARLPNLQIRSVRPQALRIMRLQESAR